MVIIFLMVFFLAVCSILYVLFSPVNFSKYLKIIKHNYTIRTIRKNNMS